MSGPLEDEDIAAWQASWNIPPDVLDEVVRRATGAGVRADTRILEGHENEVHDVVTTDGHQVVVRVAWRPGAPFECERWPMEAARAAGVPVAETLLIERTTLDGRAVSFNVQTRLPGHSIHRMRASLGSGVLRRLTRQAGVFLAAVHAVRPAGRGTLDASGAVALARPDRAYPEDRIPELASQIEGHVEQGLVEKAVAFLLAAAELSKAAPIHLLHGDWSLPNLLTDGNTLTGVVDWSGSRGGDPAIEAVGWEFWSNYGGTELEILMAGYEAAGGLRDERFELRRAAYRTANLLDAMSHFLVTNRPDLLERAKQDLAASLAAPPILTT